ncbi:MAG: hypothetical protein JJU21_04825 [Salinarimonas sp.]|nr:hypothetical protein [Salinarimonas sp.]
MVQRLAVVNSRDMKLGGALFGAAVAGADLRASLFFPSMHLDRTLGPGAGSIIGARPNAGAIFMLEMRFVASGRMVMASPSVNRLRLTPRLNCRGEDKKKGFATPPSNGGVGPENRRVSWIFRAS